MSPEQPTKALKRTASIPLTTSRIQGLKLGQTLADGAIRPGAGTLKFRRRAATSGSGIVEALFEYRHAGKTRRLTIGRYAAAEGAGTVTLAQARAEAAKLQGAVQSGLDPLAEREVARRDAAVEQAALLEKSRHRSQKTLRALLSAYVGSMRQRGKSSARDAENIFANHVLVAWPELADLPASTITPGHITRILARLVGPAAGDAVKGRTALKLRSYMGAAFKLALGAATDPMAPDGAAGFGLESNPVAAVPATSMAAKFNRAGDRVLSPTELRAYLLRVHAHPSALVRLALLLQITLGGQRIRQLLRLTHNDIIQAGGALALYDPKGRRAVARRHVLPVVPEVADLLRELAAINPSGSLFTSRGASDDGAAAVMNPATASEAVHEICSTMLAADECSTPFRGGDIRRTVETLLAQRGVGKDLRAQLLSHGIGGVQDVNYDKSLYLKQKTEVLRNWNDFLSDLCIGRSGIESTP
nr:MAG: DUF4102 domain-containing protein [Comamonadaceae bacterium]